MIQHPGDRLVKVIVKLIYPFFLCVLRSLAGEDTPAGHQVAKGLADVGVVGEVFGDDVAGPLEGILHAFYTLLRVHKGFGQRGGGLTILGKNRLRQGRQTLLPGNGAPGAPLLFVGAVQVLHLRHGSGGIDGLGQLLSQFSLVFDGFFDFLPALLQIPQVGQPGFQGAQGGVVHGPVHFFSVTGDKGNGVALVHQGYHILHVFQLLAQLPGQDLTDGFHNASPSFGFGPYPITVFPKREGKFPKGRKRGEVLLDIFTEPLYNPI